MAGLRVRPLRHRCVRPAHRWRETFAAKLKERGIEAEATRQPTRGNSRNYDPLWRIKAREDGRLRTTQASVKAGQRPTATRAEAVQAWMQLGRALAASGDADDRNLARSIARFVQDMPHAASATVEVNEEPVPMPTQVRAAAEPRR